MTRKPSPWNEHVKKVFASGRSAKGKSYSFKQALTDAAATWKSLGHSSSASHKKKHHKMKGGEPSSDEMSDSDMSPSDEDMGSGMGGGKKKRKSAKKARKSKKSGKKSRKARK